MWKLLLVLVLANTPAYCQGVDVVKEKEEVLEPVKLEKSIEYYEKEVARLTEVIKRVDRFCPRCGAKLMHVEK